MRLAIYAVTKDGVTLLQKLAKALQGDCDCYVLRRYFKSIDHAQPFDTLSALFAETWAHYEAHLFLTACGIAVRVIAPYVNSKQTDPCVLAVDEQGTFVIPLLSGHFGGGNELAVRIADILSAVPVITTATDVKQRFAPDLFAKKNGLHITDMALAKELAARSVSGEMIGISSDYGICISDDPQKKPFPHTLSMIPKDLVLGVGCKRGTDAEALFSFVQDTLAKENLPLFRVYAVCTIDKKGDEAAILSLAKRCGAVLQTYTAEELGEVTGEFSGSAFVKETVGVDNVCERSAVSGGGSLILRKTTRSGMTLAVARKEPDVCYI